MQAAALAGTATGEKVVAEFNTASGVPNTAGRVPSGRNREYRDLDAETAKVGTRFPRVKVRLDSSAGRRSARRPARTALTTALAAYTITGTTTANVTLTAASRFYVWAGVNMTAGSATACRGELGLEGTLEWRRELARGHSHGTSGARDHDVESQRRPDRHDRDDHRDELPKPTACGSRERSACSAPALNWGSSMCRT